MIHEWLKIWFSWVEHWGYGGVFVLMAMESSIIPVPSEIVLPPAAYWAAQGRMELGGVILAGTLGSYFGSVLNYGVARWLGMPFLKRYGKYFFLSPQKLIMAEAWVADFGQLGIFFARLLPVVRHLISLPAGVFRMPFTGFSVMTLLGAGLWCSLLAWFGQEVLGSAPQLLESPEQMMAVMHEKMIWWVLGVALLCGLYLLVVIYQKGSSRTPAQEQV